MKSRLNKDPIPDYFHTIIKPMAKGEKLWALIFNTF
jgi:hypothetical protein